MADIFQVVDELDNDKKQMVATRLEARTAMDSFASIRKSYFKRHRIKVSLLGQNGGWQ